jgi:hypothetical protein
LLSVTLVDAERLGGLVRADRTDKSVGCVDRHVPRHALADQLRCNGIAYHHGFRLLARQSGRHQLPDDLLNGQRLGICKGHGGSLKLGILTSRAFGPRVVCRSQGKESTAMRVLIPTVGSLLICAGVAYAALHPSNLDQRATLGKGDRQQQGNLAIGPEKPDHPAIDLSPVEPLVPTKPAVYSRARPTPLITPAEKQMLDAAGRTWAGDVRRPRNTPFVQRVIEQVKRDMVW